MISLLILWKRYLTTNDWNRRRATVDILVQLYIKEVYPIRDELVEIFEDQVWDNQKYEDFIKPFEEPEKCRIRKLFYKMISIYSLISGQITNNVLDEEICYHFLAFQFTRTYRNLLPLINNWRSEYNERHLFIDFEFVSEKWHEKMDARSKHYRKSSKENRSYRKKL